MKEYNERQLRVMRDLLQQWDSGKTNIANLITNLEALLEALESVDEDWKRAFRRQWGVLEIEYAVTLDRGQTSLSSDGIERISRAVEEMRCLLAEQLQGDGQATD